MRTITIYRFITTIFFALIALSSQGQVHPDSLDGKNISEYLQKRVMSINVKLWENVKDGKVAAYSNDSLASTISFEEVLYRTSTKSFEDVGDGEMKEIAIPFDIEDDFSGMSLRFKRSRSNVDEKAVGSEYTLRAVSPIFLLQVSGIDLGNQPMFTIAIDDLKQSIGQVDFEFIMALASQRTLFGDFGMKYFDLDSDLLEEIGPNLAYDQLSHAPISLVLKQRSFDILGYYNWSLLSAVARKIEDSGAKLYKDSLFASAYRHTSIDLMQSALVSIGNPENPDDPYDLIDTMVLYSFDLSGPYPISVSSIQGEQIVCVQPLPDNLEAKIFYPLKSALPFIHSRDLVVLREIIGLGE